ncbi:MAG: metalloregulator ArsR/SmtB family transcription factor [Paracoccaceae bacterium]|jgi:DNA-binding transcriptional ArsR family regulator|nr:metalloregulator ArsR/SmtB family transcription factor [Paracoccaceae bacterium]
MTYQCTLTALADPTRRSVFEHVANYPGPVGELAERLPVSRSAVSQHLKVLLDAGLVQHETKGTRRIYAIRREGISDLRDYLDQFWDVILDNFADEANRKED